jgi:hypothetical protein
MLLNAVSKRSSTHFEVENDSLLPVDEMPHYNFYQKKLVSDKWYGAKHEKC